MNKSNKIGLIVIPIAILGGISFALFQFDDILSFQLEDERDEISVEHTNAIASLGLPIIGFSL